MSTKVLFSIIVVVAGIVVAVVVVATVVELDVATVEFL